MEAVSRPLAVQMPFQKRPCAPKIKIVPPKPRIPQNRVEELRSIAQNPEKGVKWRTLKKSEVVFVVSEYMQLNGISSPRELMKSAYKFYKIARDRGLLDEIPFTSFEGHPTRSGPRPLVRNPQRSEAEAIALLEQNPRVPRTIIAVRQIAGKVDDVSASGFATLSAYKSALRWDGRGEFGAYAVEHSKTIWRMVREDTEMVHIPTNQGEHLKHFRRLMEKNSKKELRNYIEKHGLSPEDVEFYSKNWRMHSGVVNNALPILVEARRRSTGKPQNSEETLSELCTGSQYGADHIPGAGDIERRVLIKELSKALNAALKGLTDLQRKTIVLHHGLRGRYEHSFSEIAEALNCKKQNPHQAYPKAMERLANNPLLIKLWKELNE